MGARPVRCGRWKVLPWFGWACASSGVWRWRQASFCNSRQAPPVFGFRSTAGGGFSSPQHRAGAPLVVERLSAGESVDQALALWQVPPS